MKIPDPKLLRSVGRFDTARDLRYILRDAAMRTLSRVIPGNIWAAGVSVKGTRVKPYVTQLAKSVRESVR